VIALATLAISLAAGRIS